MGARADKLAAIPCVQEVSPIVPEGKRATLLEKAFILGGIVKALQPNLVHSWLWYSNFLCGFSRKLGFWRSVPFIASQRGDYHARYGKLRLWFTEKFIYHTADTLLTNSEHIQRSLCQRYPDKKIFAIPNLLELPDCNDSLLYLSDARDSDEKRIVSTGRFAPEKGHRYLIEALSLLKEARLQRMSTGESALTWRCTFLGEGELEAELRGLAAKYHITEQMAFPGFCDDVFPVLATADAFVLPSLHESSPNALIEAMGIGLPCIASEVGGIPDLIEDGKNGLCVPPKEPEALAAALHRVLTEPDFARELGRNARLTIQQRFNNDESIRKLEEIYRTSAARTP